MVKWNGNTTKQQKPKLKLTKWSLSMRLVKSLCTCFKISCFFFVLCIFAANLCLFFFSVVAALVWLLFQWKFLRLESNINQHRNSLDDRPKSTWNTNASKKLTISTVSFIGRPFFVTAILIYITHSVRFIHEDSHPWAHTHTHDEWKKKCT